jgi:hypothetical protein
MASQIHLTYYEVLGYTFGSTRSITTRVLASSTSEARSIVSKKNPSFSITAVYPV